MMTYEERNKILDEVAQAILRMHQQMNSQSGESRFLVYDHQFAIADLILSMKTTES